ncbi:MAG TPA: ABC transporter ATP-binding protein [bacterium]|nr:ABC transporter ATP-binding protein [bacterium]
MAGIRLDHVSIEFPIYNASNRSLKKAVLRVGSGGRIARDAGDRLIVRALRDISLDLKEGDRLGLIGNNGSGKTTLLRVLAGIYEPVQGSYHLQGRVTPLFDPGLGMEPEATGYENIMVRGLYLGLSRREILAMTQEIVEFTELGDYLSMPVRMYSSGMMLRLAFSVSTCVVPEILLLDEWIGVSDPTFLQKAERRMDEFVSRSSILVLASHSGPLIQRVCNKVVQLEQGEIKAMGPPEQFADFFQRGQPPAPEPAPSPLEAAVGQRLAG